MIEHLRITVLADNYVTSANLLAEHGLSMLVEADNHRILFDTGQGKVLLHNAATLGILLSDIDTVVLSHGHYDHTGGLADLLRQCSPKAVFLHPAALQPKYGKNQQPPHRSIGVPQNSLQALNEFRERFVLTLSATEIVPGVWCTGEIPRQPENGPAPAGFFLDAECHEPDLLADDQALFLETQHGLVVVAGCTHSGVANTLDHVSTLTGRGELYALIGGLHLGRATHQQLEVSANAIGRRNCQILAPCHCTGMGAHSYLRARFHSLVRDVGVGTSLNLNEF